ncbi:MAG: maturation protein [Sanya fiers-like virus 5]|nr:MAG: maturation protein [Sanya fiers-like virus 5]
MIRVVSDRLNDAILQRKEMSPMAVNLVTYTPKILRKTINGVKSSTTRSTYVSKYQWKPDKAKGQVITLPGGSTFRKATSRMIWSRELVPLSTGTTSFRRFGENWVIDFPNGGYQSDFAIEPQMPSVKSAIGSIDKLCNAPLAIPTEMRNEANTKALLDIAGQKANIGENLATFRQTLDLLAKPSWGLVNHMRNAYANRKMRPFYDTPLATLRKYGKIPKDAANIYLMYVYGAIPFMKDIYGLMELLKERGAKTHLLYGHGTSSRQCEFRVGSYTGGGATVSVPTGTERALVRTRLWARIDPNCVGLRALNQVGLLNPVSVAWELVPFSFIIDWFAPIGPMFQALTAPAGLIFVDGTSSNRFTLTGTVYEVAYDANATGVKSTPATAGVTVQGYFRQALTGWPRAGIYASTNPFTGDRPYKALALAITNLYRLKKM